MSCEKFQAALIAAAASGAESSPDPRAHAAFEHAKSCAYCAAELAQQRSLLAAIDTNLHRQMNSPVPLATLHRFEARLAQEPPSVPSRSLKFSWFYSAAAFATAAALILIAMPGLHMRKRNPQAVALSEAAPSRTARSTTDDRPQMPPTPLEPAVQPATRRIKHRSQAVTASQPEILVPPDEQVALDRFIARGNTRREFVVALATPVPQGVEPSFKGLEIPDINNTDLVIQPIATEARR